MKQNLITQQKGRWIDWYNMYTNQDYLLDLKAKNSLFLLINQTNYL